MRATLLKPRFIGERPTQLEEGVLYISVSFRTSVHLCCCGCGNEVWLPIRPNRWIFTYDGESITMSPSVGNWSLPCRSHYWIRNSQIQWAPKWNRREIEAGRRRTRERDMASFEPEKSTPRWRRLVTRKSNR